MNIFLVIFFVIFIIFFGLLITSDSVQTFIQYEIKQIIHAGADIFDDYFHRHDNKVEPVSKSGQIAVVTGGARGIGIEIVKMLLECDMHVIIGCRNTEAGKRVENDARKEGINTGSLECIPLHLDSLQSIREFSDVVCKKYPKINILINNAATLNERYVLTANGFESHFGVNYLGHFYLTHLLLQNLIDAKNSNEKSRIVNVSSCGHYFGNINFDDINLKKKYLQMMGYSQSKLALVIFTIYLNSMLENENVPIEVFSVNPGIVNTDMVCSIGINKTLPFIPKFFYKTLRQGATSIVYAAISPQLNGKGGSYINNCRIKDVNPIANSTETQEKLFNLSKKLLKVNEFGKPIFDS